MKISLGNAINLSLKYVYLRGNCYYYQRKIPLDLQERYGSSKLIKVNLKTTDLKQVAQKVTALN